MVVDAQAIHRLLNQSPIAQLGVNPMAQGTRGTDGSTPKLVPEAGADIVETHRTGTQG